METAFAVLTKLAVRRSDQARSAGADKQLQVWLQKYVPSLEAAEQEARARRNVARRAIAELWESLTITHRAHLGVAVDELVSLTEDTVHSPTATTGSDAGSELARRFSALSTQAQLSSTRVSRPTSQPVAGALVPSNTSVTSQQSSHRSDLHPSPRHRDSQHSGQIQAPSLPVVHPTVPPLATQPHPPRALSQAQQQTLSPLHLSPSLSRNSSASASSGPAGSPLFDQAFPSPQLSRHSSASAAIISPSATFPPPQRQSVHVPVTLTSATPAPPSPTSGLEFYPHALANNYRNSQSSTLSSGSSVLYSAGSGSNPQQSPRSPVPRPSTAGSSGHASISSSTDRAYGMERNRNSAPYPFQPSPQRPSTSTSNPSARHESIPQTITDSPHLIPSELPVHITQSSSPHRSSHSLRVLDPILRVDTPDPTDLPPPAFSPTDPLEGVNDMRETIPRAAYHIPTTTTPPVAAQLGGSPGRSSRPLPSVPLDPRRMDTLPPVPVQPALVPMPVQMHMPQPHPIEHQQQQQTMPPFMTVPPAQWDQDMQMQWMQFQQFMAFQRMQQPPQPQAQ